MRRRPGRGTLLRVNERLADAALDVSGIGAFEWDPTTRTTRWSGPVFGGLLPPGVEADGLDFELLVRDYVSPEHAHELRRACRDPDTTRLDQIVRLAHPGQTRARVRAARRHDGTWIGTVELHVGDLDPSVRVENKRLRAMLDAAPAILWTIDPDGVILDSNQEVAGVTARELVGLSILDFVHEKDRAALRAALDRVFDEGKTSYFEGEVPDFGWFGGLYAPLLEGDDVVAAIVAGADVTRRRHAENEARESESTFRALADSTPLMMWLIDPRGRPEWANRALRDFVGYRGGEAKHGPLHVHPEERDNFTTFLEHLARQAAWEAEVRLERFDGEYRSCLINALPRRDEDGRFSGYVASAVDVTDLRRAEAAMTEHRGRLAHVLRIQSLDQMALGLAHELHQPLAAISAATGAALRGLDLATPDVSRVASMLTEAQTQAIRAGDLLGRMRDFIRSSAADAGSDEPRAVELNAVVTGVTELARPEAARRGIQLTAELTPGKIHAHVGPDQIQQVLINLIQNGLEAMAPDSGGRLCVQTEQDPRGAISIRVLDEGRGLPPELGEQMFDVFFTTRPTGLGMGLAISRSIVESYGGTLSGENRDDAGACFTVTLPGISAASPPTTESAE